MKFQRKTKSAKRKIIIQNLKLLVLSFGFAFFALHFALAEDKPSSSELITKAWEAHGKYDVEATFQYTNQCIQLYKQEAAQEQASLTSLPKDKEIASVQALNDVAVAYFIQAESYMRQDKIEDAKKTFQLIIDKYSFAQSWDPRGWYWQIADASKKSLEKINTGVIGQEQKPQVSQLVTKIILYDAGREEFVDYAKYGQFIGAGTKDYKYVINDQEGLSAAVGEGIYPNTTSVRWDPEYKKALKEKRLEGSHWDFVHSPDLEAAFLKWATAPESPATKLFYTGLMFEKSGLIKQAIKCYYAIVVHFPGSYGWTYWHTPWYIGQAAASKVISLLRSNPQIGYRLTGLDIKIINGYDNSVANDIVIANPGKFEKVTFLQKITPRPAYDLLNIKRRRGKGKVHLIQYKNGDWQMIVDGRPYIIKGITYAPTKIGESPDDKTLSDWMKSDFNKNGKIDGPYDAYVDRNNNGKQDSNEPSVGDFRLMKMMGVNTMRIYHQPFQPDKQILRQMYEKYGIRVIMGDFLGKYAIGSGASWNPGTDYKNPEHKKNMLASVRKMVEEYKNEPYILFWLLGNENVYGYACNADKEPDAYFSFVNQAAEMIKSIDTAHPVAICNGDVLYLNSFSKNAPAVDIFGINAYRGDYGFGFLWKQVKEAADVPVFITEYGCPAYSQGRLPEEGEQLQANYHKAAWEDIAMNMAFQEGAGNSIGAVVFEWVDEWWKAYEPSLHDTKGIAIGPFPDGYYYEEWFGLCSQGQGKDSPFLRHLRKSYYLYQKLWR
ncbi:MAG: hypothetical protein MUF05_01025 [Candidatus Omnitrophica bacterium]|jgi:beta-glucuronidase|nr:hypothetical protein [Candidatus Omnitrophota bacterium]